MMLDGWDEDESLSNGRDGTEEGLERQLDIIVDVERECHVEKALEGGVNHTHGCSVQVCGCVSGAVIVGTGSILRALGVVVYDCTQNVLCGCTRLAHVV